MSGDVVVGGIIYRRNGFNEWCEVDPESDRLFVAFFREQDCLDEIVRLRERIMRLEVAGDALTEAVHHPPRGNARDALDAWKEASHER